jgi:predicted nucleotidyltransferase
MRNVGLIKDHVSRQGGVIGLITLSGAHSYGFASSNSDYDYRGFFIFRTGKILSLKYNPNKHEHLDPKFDDELIDCSLMEIKKFMNLAFTMNCNVLEHIFGDSLVNTTESLELKRIIQDSLSKKGLYDSYKGMAGFNYKKFIYTGNKKTVKKYLYIFRALMAGIEALQTKKIEPNIYRLNQKFKDPIVTELIEDKISGLEDDLAKPKYKDIDIRIKEYMDALDAAYIDSDLPEFPIEDFIFSADNFLKRIRQRNWDMVTER